MAVVCAGMRYPIRQMDADDFSQKATAVIQYVAKAYCGGDEESNISPVWNECLLLLRKEFRSIGVEEIRHAFRLASSGTINANLIAYRGVFTVQMFGAVLSKYVEYRRKVHAEIVNREHATAFDRRQQEKQARWKAEFEELTRRIIGLTKENNEIGEWGQVGVGWFEILEKNGLIAVNDTYKAASWIESKKQAVRDFLSESSGLSDTVESSAIKRELIKDPDGFPEKLKQKALLVYRKKLAFLSLAIFQENGNY